MITLQHKETIHGNCEASIKCLSKGFPCNLEKDGFPKNKDQINSREALVTIEPKNSLCRDLIENTNQFYQKPSYEYNFSPLPSFYPDSQNVHLIDYASQFYHPSDNQFQCVPFGMLPQNYLQHDFQHQDFHYFVVIDFEATCDKETIPNPQEIIEFPSVIVGSLSGQLEACFQTYVRPTCNQQLSEFCKDLTGIQQVQVDRGVTLSEALQSHDKWLETKGIKNANFVVVTWSNWDCRVMLETECRLKKIQKPSYFNRWINLKVPFQEVYGGVRNLKEAVQLAGLTWQGRPHCGLDDAKNTARLLALFIHQGFKLSITNSLMWQTSDSPLSLNHYQENHMSTVPSNKPNDFHVPIYQFQPSCYCGVKSHQAMIRKPGPKHGCIFFGCGNWTATRGALCHYFEWAALDLISPEASFGTSQF